MRDSDNRNHRTRAHAGAALALLAVAGVFGFTPASSLGSSVSAAASAATTPTTPSTDDGGTGVGTTPPPVVGTPAMDTPTGFVFPVKEAHRMLGPSSWSRDQGVDLGFGLGWSKSFCGSKANLVAVDDAVVTKIGISGFGSKSPVIKLLRGRYKGWSVYYGHSQPTVVKVGQRVTRGQVISHIGCGRVGISSAPHLEFGMFRGGYCCSNLLSNRSVYGILKRMFPKAVRIARARR